MSTDRDVQRLNLVIKKWSAYSHSAMLTWTADELADKFKQLTPEQIAVLDAEIDRPRIVVRSYRDESRMPSKEGFYTPPRSSTSSEGESTGYR
jgi:hypothetical protein